MTVIKSAGKYRLVRRTHHTHLVGDTDLTYRNLVCPSHGTSEVTFRASTDSQYEVELMQTTSVDLRTWNGQTAIKIGKTRFSNRKRRMEHVGGSDDASVQQVLHEESVEQGASDDHDSLFGGSEAEGQEDAISPDADIVMHDDGRGSFRRCGEIGGLDAERGGGWRYCLPGGGLESYPEPSYGHRLQSQRKFGRARYTGQDAADLGYLHRSHAGWESGSND